MTRLSPGSPRRRRRTTRAVALAAAGVLVLLGPTTTVVAAPAVPATTDEPAPTDVETAGTAGTTETAGTTGTTTEEATAQTSVPKNVLSWYAGPGLEAAEAEADELSGEGDLAVGPPHPVHQWDPDFIDGTQTSSPTLPDGQWVAAIVREAPDGPAPVGALRAGPFDGSEPESTAVVLDADVGALVLPEELSFTLVHDPSIDGWFATAEGEVWSVGAQAREILHGAVPLSVLLAFFDEITATPTPTAGDEDVGEEGSGLVPLTVIAVIVLLGLAGAWLLIRNYHKADSRLEADIRAGLTPLEGIPRLDGPGRASPGPAHRDLATPGPAHTDPDPASPTEPPGR